MELQRLVCLTGCAKHGIVACVLCFGEFRRDRAREKQEEEERKQRAKERKHAAASAAVAAAMALDDRHS